MLLTIEGHPFEIRPDTIDRAIVTEVVDRDCYHLRSRVFEPGAQILDIGAHVGTFSVYAARRFPDARLWAFEMDDENAALLMTNTAGLANIIAKRAAVVGNNLPTGYRRNAVNTGAHHVIYGGEGLPLPGVVTTAGILAGLPVLRVDLLKLDCEGAEHDIMRAAAANGVIAHVRSVAAEVHRFFGETVEDFKALLSGLGFVVTERPINNTVSMIYAEHP